MKIKKGDLVKVIAGSSDRKGKLGKILEVCCNGQRVKVEGIAKIKRHVKPQKDPKHPEGGIIESIASIHISNVMLMSESLNRPVRLGAMFTQEGKKQRVARGKNIKADEIV